MKIGNVGIAPFYYNWNLELGLFATGMDPVVISTGWDIRSVIDADPITFVHEANLQSLPDGMITLAIRLKNPLLNGDPVVFANLNPNPPAPDWQVLGTLNRPPVLNPIGNHTVRAGQTLRINISTTDPDGNNPTFSASGE
ncbi:MAG: hypothetical protein JW706_09170 [Opitutales bacterium]|nr:hypothetical protein [Opitutales bacterium]